MNLETLSDIFTLIAYLKASRLTKNEHENVKKSVLSVN